MPTDASPGSSGARSTPRPTSGIPSRQVADVSEVVAALQRGDDVFALFPTSHGMMPMRRFRVVEYDNGWQTVNLDGPPTHEHEIHDMLHVAS